MTHPPDLPICITCPEYAHPDSEFGMCEKHTLSEYENEILDFESKLRLDCPNQYRALLGEISSWTWMVNHRKQVGEKIWRLELELLEAERLERMAE